MALLLLFFIQGQVGMEKLGCLTVQSSQAIGLVGLRRRSRVIWQWRFGDFIANGFGRLMGLGPSLSGLVADILPVGILSSTGFGDSGLQVVENRVATAHGVQVAFFEVDQIGPE